MGAAGFEPAVRLLIRSSKIAAGRRPPRYSRGVRLLPRLGSVAVLILACAPSSALGAVTFGAPDVTTDGNANVASIQDGNLIFQFRAPTDRRYGSPIDGVIVRWRVRVNTNQNGMIKLRPLRPLGGDTFMPVSSTTEPVTTGPAQGLFTFDTRIPVKAGDLLAIQSTVSPSSAVFTAARSTVAGAVQGSLGGPTADGQTGTGSAGFSFEILTNADVEPDADGDGFGDQTQDQCTTSAATQGSCPVVPAAPDRSAPVGLASFDTTLKLRSALRRGLRGFVSSTEAAAISGSAEISARIGRKLGLKSARTVTVATGSTSLAAPGVASLRLTFTKKAKRKLKRARKVALVLRFNLTDQAHNTATVTRKITLRR